MNYDEINARAAAYGVDGECNPFWHWQVQAS